MSFLVEILLWVIIGLVFYTYIGYGFIVYIWLLIRGKKPTSALDHAHLPRVALIIAAYNEADFIEAKINNTRALNYPADKLKVIFVTDGSTDQTPEIVRAYPQFTCFHSPDRKGKGHAMNRAVALIDEPILVFCDANTELNADALLYIVQHYQDLGVGGVAGEKRILQVKDGLAATKGEGFYWRYESFLKRLDSDLHTVVGAAGELFSVRRSLYEPIQPGTIIEDFVLTMRICEKGYTVKYEPNAYAIETASASIEEEKKRKLRISAGGFQAIAMLQPLLNIGKFGITSFQYISHRVMRWAVAPFCLPLAFLANVWLVVFAPNAIFNLLFLGQCLFYLAAVCGYFLETRGIKNKLLYIPYYFVFMNGSVIQGYFRYRKGQQSVLWEKAKRQIITESNVS
jgi:poly-beta-1,6-N-acetyl-D-glucosamine synthase